jgi:ferritin-like metal-binding protein YciE
LDANVTQEVLPAINRDFLRETPDWQHCNLARDLASQFLTRAFLAAIEFVECITYQMSEPIPKEQAMKIFSANIQDFRSLYITNLKKALDMEQKITKALPDMMEKSSDPELVAAFDSHLDETEGHVTKLVGLLRRHIGDTKADTCKVINGLITEASDTIKDVTDPSVRDVALISAAQQVEHHEIAIYGTLRHWAEMLGLAEDAVILESIETEEVNADELLSNIAERVNYQAAA